MSATFLEGRFQTPAFHEVAHDLFDRLRLVGGKEGFGRSLSRWVASEDPPNGQRCRAKPIPPGSATAQLQHPFSLAIPVEREALPYRAGVIQHMVQRREPLAHDAGTPNHMGAAH